MTAGLLHDKVTVERQRLSASQGGVIGIEVRPTRLYEPQSWSAHKVGDRLEKKIRMGAEIGIKDGNVLAIGLGKPPGQCSGLEAIAVMASQYRDVCPLSAVQSHSLLAQTGCLVG